MSDTTQLKFRGTKGPWRWELNEKYKQVQLVGGKPMFDVIVMDFTRYGMGGAAPRFNSEIAPSTNVMQRAEMYGVVVKGREHHSDWFKSLSHPDAHLIAAAPDLLDACQSVLSLIENHHISVYRSVTDQLTAAINKALDYEK